MNEENKKQDLPVEGADKTPELTGEDKTPEGLELTDELEALKNTFQEKYDETVEEAQAGPVIQELEECDDRDDEDEDEDEDDKNDNKEEEVRKPKKKRKTGKVVAITLLSLVLVAVIGSLAAYMVASITNPNFSSFISTYSQALAADNYDDKIKYLEASLEYCSDADSVFQKAMATTVLEEIAVAVYEEEGYASAYSFIKSNFSDEQTAKPVNSTFKKILKTVKQVEDFSLEVFGTVYDNLGDAETLPEYDVLSKGIDIPDAVKTEAETVIKAVGEAYLYNKTTKGIEGAVLAMNYYANAYSGLLSIGADADELSQNVVIELYENGFVTEAAVFASVAVDPEKEISNEDYKKVTDEIAAFKELGVSVAGLAEKAFADEKTSEDDILTLVKSNVQTTDANAAIIADFVAYAAEGFNAEKSHNLTRAAECFATLTSVLEAFGLDDISMHIKTAQVIFDSGNLNDSSTLVTTYLTEEAMQGATDEQKAVVDRMNKVFDALNASSEIFSPYYAEYYQYGTAIDLEKLKEELDAIITEESDNYDKGFVNYCLYFAAMTTENTSEASKYIELMAQQMPDLPFVYGYYQITEYLDAEKFSSAVSCAEQLLEINIADGFANSIIAFGERINGNLDAAIEKAQFGYDYNPESPECAEQLAIAYMLKGDLEAAFTYVSTLCNTSQSIKAYDLVLIFNKLYAGTNEDIKTELESLVSAVNQTYTYYSVTSLKDTTDILEGTKTLEDVFMSGDYTLSD